MGQVFDRLWSKAGQNRVPLTGAFELLPVCNLACRMCYVRKDMAEVKALGGLMPPEFWLDIAGQAMKEGFLLPLLTGGEPFLYPDIRKLIAEMIAMGLKVSINSNATLIDEPTARWLSGHCPTRINITLYGASEATYERLCGDGEAYHRVRRAVEWLKRYGIPVKFNTSITQYNVQDLDAMMAYTQEVGSPVQVATYMFPPLRRDSSMVGENDRMTPKQAAHAKVRADLLQREPDWLRAQAKRYRNFVHVTKEMLEEQARGAGHEMTCRAGRCSFWVDWQGNLCSCGINNFYSENLRGQNFADVWQKLVRYTNEFRFSPVCTNCPNYRLCHSCPSMILNESGTVDGRPEYLCEMNEYIAQYYQQYAGDLPAAPEAEPESYRTDEQDDVCGI